jgi:UPF0042 nucleotide-binding protein
MPMKKVIIVTGLSGSGKSIALHTLEDLKYYCIDNIPMFLLEVLAQRLIESQEPAFDRTAVGIDARSSPEGLARLPELVRELRQHRVDCRILFLEAQPDTLIQRFNETRRKHPLSGPEHPLADALELERRLLEPVLDQADLRIDTSHTNIYQLRDLVRERVEGGGAGVSILLESFGFKHGVPRDVDFVFDARCLPNPHWQPDLRKLTGRDAPVRAFLGESPEVARMEQDIQGFLDRWIPAFEADGRSYLTIAVGCTGGQHRSVYLVERLKDHFAGVGRRVLTRHRELS